MSVWDDVALGFTLFLGISGGIYVGAYLSLGMAGQFVDETLREVRTLAYELLANKTVQALIQAADKIPNLNKKGGIIEKAIGGIGRLLGFGGGG